MMTDETSTIPDSFALSFPTSWDRFPLNVDEFRQYRNRYLETLTGSPNGIDLTKGQLRQVELLLAQVRQFAVEKKANMIATFVALEPKEPTDGDQPDAELVGASMVSSRLLRDEIGTNVPLMADVLIRVLGAGETTLGDDDRITYDEIEPPIKIELGGYDAVKLTRLMTATAKPGEQLKLFSQSYLVPVANGDAVVMLHFSTINFDYARQFAELFDRIADTLTFYHPDDPTFADGHPLPTQPVSEQGSTSDGAS